MDVLTQGALGAILAQSASRQEEMRWATAIGFLAGLAADADVFIRSAADPLLTIEYHRHFTHSLIFVPVGALLVSLLLWLYFRNRMPFGRLYLFSLLGYSMSGMLDAFTSYGTYLLWPFYSEPVSLKIISIIDPLFTLILIIALLTALLKRERKSALIGIALAVCYLSIGMMQQYRAKAALEELAVTRGHQPQQLIAKPSFGNILLWRGIYAYDGYYYIDAIRLSAQTVIYPGKKIKQFHPDVDLPWLKNGSVLHSDILRFAKFSQSYLVYHPLHKNVLGDIRYAMLPDSDLPLWGIEFDPDQPDRHVSFRTFRETAKEVRQRFLDMLLGNALPAP